MSEQAETGMEFLTAGEWLPPPVDPQAVLRDIQEQRYEACLGRVGVAGLDGSNVVERLALAYALLHLKPIVESTPTVMWETLETLGFDVSASFAERGADACLLFEVVRDLEQGETVEPLRLSMAYQCLGRLWAAAFSAPPGYEHYIARSAFGSEPRNLSFFHPIIRPESMPPLEEARYLRRLTDLLQAAVAIKELPATAVGQRLEFSNWRAPAWAVNMKRPGGYSWRMEVHVKNEGLAGGCRRFTVKLIEASAQETVASIRAVVMEGDTGSYDDFLALSALAHGSAERTVESVFAPAQVVTLCPRVRWLLEAAGNRLFRLMVIEGIYAAPRWRRRGISALLLQQLLVETEMVDVMIGRPAAFELDTGVAPVVPFGVQAGYAVAKLALARMFATLGAEYLISGTMGMRLQALQRLHAAGTEARLG